MVIIVSSRVLIKKYFVSCPCLKEEWLKARLFLPVSETTLCCSQLFLGSLVLVEINKKPRMFSLNLWLSGALCLAKGAW